MQLGRYTIGLMLGVGALATSARGQVTMSVTSTQNVHSISPYIYGTNSSKLADATFVRAGGNRATAYNWENNASNAGSDWYFENDNLFTSSTTPGQGILPTLQGTAAKGQATLLTIPMAGYVAADTNHGGDIRYNGNTWNQSLNGGNGGWVQGTYNPNYLTEHFKVSLPAKGSAFSLTPNTSDGSVYQDEFVNWVNSKRANNQTVFYNLDNEPDLWPNTHTEVHPTAATYSELVTKSTQYAKAIKAVAPNTKVFGGVNYGWNGYTNLQGQPADSSIQSSEMLNFQASYLKQMKAAEQANGQRLLDVLDMHWYPEAYGNGQRITGNDTSAASRLARIQAPRSLWDATYGYSANNPLVGENSWIAQFSTQGPIKLLKREQNLINTYYPSTKIGISEYQYGGGGDYSGGIAEADVLGVFGREDVYAANWWDDGSNATYVNAAMKLYCNMDGNGKKFGDISIGATTSNDGTSSVYASLDSTDEYRMVLVLINKSSSSQVATISMDYRIPLMKGHVYQFATASSTIQTLSDINLTVANQFAYTMPANSVTAIELVPEPTGAGVLALVAAAAALCRHRR